MAPLEQQMCAFLICVGAGCLAGFLFDVYRTVVSYFRVKRTALAVGDIIFWLVLAALVFTLILLGNEGEVRGFMLLGLVLGAAVYYKVFGERSTRAIARGIAVICRVLLWGGRLLAWLWFLVTAPFRLLFFALVWPWKTIAGLVGKLWNRLVVQAVWSRLKAVLRKLRRKK